MKTFMIVYVPSTVPDLLKANPLQIMSFTVTSGLRYGVVLKTHIGDGHPPASGHLMM